MAQRDPWAVVGEEAAPAAKTSAPAADPWAVASETPRVYPGTTQVASEPVGLLESLYNRAQAGIIQPVAGFARNIADTLAPDVGPLSPRVQQLVDAVLPQRRAGAAIAQKADVADEQVQFLREEAGGERPLSLGDVVRRPGNAVRYYGGMAAESAPLIGAAMLARNPAAANAIASGGTGAQQYADLRQQGVSAPQAITEATGAALFEGAGGRPALDVAFEAAPLLSRIGRAAALEAVGESGSEGLQTALPALTGREDVGAREIIRAMVDAAIVGAPLGAGEAIAGSRGDVPQSNAIPVPSVGPGPAVPGVGPVPLDPSQIGSLVAGFGREPTADLDALIASLPSQPVAAGGAGTPVAAPAEGAPVSLGSAIRDAATTGVVPQSGEPTLPLRGQDDGQAERDVLPRAGDPQGSGYAGEQAAGLPARGRGAGGSDAAAGDAGAARDAGSAAGNAAAARDRPDQPGAGEPGADGGRRGARAGGAGEGSREDGIQARGEAGRAPTGGEVVDRIAGDEAAGAGPRAEGNAPGREEGAREEGREEEAVTYTAADFLPGMGQEVGWSQRGGELMRERREGDESLENFGGRPTGDVVGRTAWVAKLAPDGTESRLWRDRPDKSLNESRAQAALEKAAAGDKLTAIEQRFVDHASQLAEEYAATANRESRAYHAELAEYDAAARSNQRQAMRAELGDVDDATADEALTLDDLVHRAYAAGAEPEAILDATFDGTPAQHARALWRMIAELESSNAPVPEAAERSRAGGDQAREEGREASAPARGQAGLFGAPSAREVVDAEARRRDAERDGRTGSGRTDMASGAGELFAGPRPQQESLEDVSVRDRLAERRAEREAERSTRTVRNMDQRARAVVEDSGEWRVQFEDKSVSPGRYASREDAMDARDAHNRQLRGAPEIDEAQAAIAGGNEDADAKGFREPVQRALGALADRVEFHRGYAGLPERLRLRIEARAAARGGRGKTSGLYDQSTGRVYLFTDVISSPERAAFTAAHEIAGHHGLRALLGDKLDPALGIARQNPTVKAVADAIAGERNIDQKREKGILLATEEALAELAAAVRTGDYGQIESRYDVPVPEGVRASLTRAIDNFLKRLRAMIDDLFGRHVFTDEDVRALLENAWQAAEGRTTLDDSALESTAPDQTETPEFKRWFGDSKVVDANGAPMVVYHGTNQSFDSFDETRHGQNTTAASSIAFFFTEDPREAGEYADLAGRTQLADAVNVEKLERDYQRKIASAERRRDWGEYERLTLEMEEVVYGAINADPSGMATVPAYLSVQNPMVLDMGDSFDGHRVRDAIKEAQAAGHDGLKLLNVYDPVALNNARGDEPFSTTQWVAFKPTQIKSATANRGTFDPENPSILESVAESERRAEQRRAEAAQTLPVSRGTPGWNYDTGVWEGAAGTAKRARMNLQDKMTGWEDVQNQIAGQIGQAIPDAQNVYQAENLMHGRTGEAIKRLEEAHIKPLMQALKAAKVTVPQLEEYLYARHAEERNQQIARINPAMPDGGSGMTTAQAQKILEGAGPEVRALANRVDSIVGATRRRLLQHGLIDQSTFDAMEAAYQHYVPLRGKRDGDEVEGTQGGAGRGLDTRRPATKRALGRGAGNLAENILAEVIGDAQRSIVTAEKARVGRTVMRLVLANPNPDLWTVEPVQTERALDSQGEVYERVLNDWNDPSVVGVRHNGQLYKVQINQPELAQALNHVGVEQVGQITRLAGMFNRYLSAMLTKYNPAFTGVNAVRDAMFGLTGMAAERGEGTALRAALKYPFAAASSFKAAHGKLGNSPMDQMAAEFAEHGGRTGYVNMPSVEDISKKIGSGSITSYSPSGLKRAAATVAEQIEHVNDAVENALRLSAYATLRADGVSPEQAATYAKNLTVNFNRKGLQGSAINSWFLFYNASIQGSKRFIDVAKKPKTWAYLGALATAQVVATMAMLGMEDDDGTPLWDKIPDHVKARNLVLPAGKDGTHFMTVPMPYGFNMMTWGAGRFTDAFARPKKKQNTAGKIAAETVSNLTQAFSPIPLDDGALGLVPTIARIPLAVQVNRDNFDRPIRREDPYAQAAVPRSSMGRPDTIEIFKATASGLNRIGGGDEYTPAPLSMFDRAPEDLEFIAEQLTGGAGRFVLDTARAAGTIADPGAELEPRKTPLANKFFANVSEVDSQRSDFYERRETIETAMRRVRTVARQDGVAAAQKLMATMPELTGARFKRNAGGAVRGGKTGDIQFEGAPGSVFANYKAAAKATSTRGEEVEDAYNEAPATGLPSAKSRARDAKIRAADERAMLAQKAFNAAWNKATDL